MSLTKFELKILEFLADYTWHVLDESGAPAKIPKWYLEEKFGIQTNLALSKLFQVKAITTYSFSNPKAGLRITEKGAAFTNKYGNPKRILVKNNSQYEVIPFEQFVKQDPTWRFAGG